MATPKPIQVFWIDDRHAEMRDFKVRAENQGIILHPFRSAEKGLPVLEEKLHFFDAVLLDAYFPLEEAQVQGTERLNGLRAAIDKLNELKRRKPYKAFILTGEERVERNDEFEDSFGSYYLKRDPKQLQKLLADLRLEAEAMTDTQVRHRYQRVFDVCSEPYIGESAAKHMLAILRTVHDGEATLEDDLYFNHLRKCLEWMFRAANRLGMVHDKCIERDEVNLTASSRFMAGLDNSRLMVRNSRPHFPKLIADHVRGILDVTNAFSHTEGEDKEVSKMRLEEHRRTVASPYLLYSLTFQLMDVLLWFKTYADANSDAARNKANWVDTTPVIHPDQLLPGKVTRLHPEKKFGEFTADADGNKAFLPPDLVSKHGLMRDMRIAVSIRPGEKGPIVAHVVILD